MWYLASSVFTVSVCCSIILASKFLLPWPADNWSGAQNFDVKMMLQQTETVKRMTPDTTFRASFEHHPRSFENHSLEKITKNPDFSGFFGRINGRGRRIRTLGTRFWRPLLYQLSYTPISLAALPSGDQPFWWAFRDSNPGPAGYEPAALTN